ncbi:hypothetical protein HAX54_018961 [Datura stramonium]|uniref:Uncharacterized protein n=1 Tax=Datura stramonium TaxID=4076 RepID=A0ABS8UN98_DATST|nr:hypothetical protein [Datura stramonium]
MVVLTGNHRFNAGRESRFEFDYFKNDFPDIYDLFQMHDWDPFTMPLDPCFLELVQEFYASYRAQQDILKHKGRVDKMPYLSSMLIWGQIIHITLDEINFIYWDEPVRSNRDFKRKLDKKDDQFEWVAEIIDVGQPHWAISKGVIHRHDLKFEA